MLLDPHDDSDVYLQPAVISDPGQPVTQNGHTKRKSKKSLPRCFFLYDKRIKTVFSAFLLSQCARLIADPRRVYWKCSRVVKLRQPLVAGVGDVAWTSTLVHFTPQFEQTARMSDSEVGGTMNVHFLESQETRWFAWPSTPELQSKLDQFDG